VVVLLTKTGGLLGPIAVILGWIMNAIYEFFHLFGIQNIALSIIIFTFIVRALMLPLTIKQQKFTKLSSRMNPELQKIQAKYKGKKDQDSLRKQQEETQALYEKFGANPTAGCLPMLITLPIMFALYYVINNVPAYVDSVKDLYATVANGIMSEPNYTTVLGELSKGIARISSKNDFSTLNFVIDALAHFDTNRWEQLKTSFPDLANMISVSQVSMAKVNGFLGFNIANNPGWKFPGIIIPILAMVLQFIQGKQLEVKNKGGNQDPTANAMKSMNYVMPVMSGFFCVTFPIGIGIYWIASSAFAIVQQFFVNKYMDKINVDELIAKNVAKASKKKKRSFTSAATNASLQQLAKTQTKTIESTVSEKAKVSVNSDSSNDQEEVKTEQNKNTKSSGSAKSISEIANLLQNRNIDKGDK
jgi:YidC/Oxa1 family membrane protein insertase